MPGRIGSATGCDDLSQVLRAALVAGQLVYLERAPPSMAVGHVSGSTDAERMPNPLNRE